MDWNGISAPGWLWLVGLLGLIAAVAAFGLRYKRRGDAALRRVYDGLTIHSSERPGAVPVRFHTYHGLLVYAVQTEHRFWAGPKDARAALWRLHRFNLVWGMFARGLLLIPLVSYTNYLAQKRSIARRAPKPAAAGLDDELA
ncbi:hypothetical protein OJF2_02510 [Aquisphaera giovannonii]|uniref:Uncharacterized protein n=1 Tax=Aquisphaera giovannonii TaxID=406548 RepID=A0A5B9VTF5_9BACT|nr:hypothetical protein [Aquisphaera giovannonii]QEH31786.1 hypothetical protein OJF2_02510 [Aquisphaera giovannonii]